MKLNDWKQIINEVNDNWLKPELMINKDYVERIIFNINFDKGNSLSIPESLYTNLTPDKLRTLNDKIACESMNPQVNHVYFDQMRPYVDNYFNKPMPGLIAMSPMATGSGVCFVFKEQDYNQLNPELTKSLDKITHYVNDNMDYDIQMANLDCVVKDHRQEKIINPLFKGICIDSTYFISRELIKQELDVYWFTHSLSTNYGTTHSLITCFDDKGHWLLINGKRPRDNDYAIIPSKALFSEKPEFKLFHFK
ncbi:MAG: hypothetical protein WC307_01030 [Candidatus Nanoarchaeia archaeon]|jgi:hypothetical protein